MTRRQAVVVCGLAALALAITTVMLVSRPQFRVKKGMTYDEVENVLGKQLQGLRPVSLVDGSWTGLWQGPNDFIEVTFGSDDRVRESPSSLRRLLDWLGL